jgi:catechol 2,3-dioxygenase-like lactoylglutathione lyase family enzyme
MKQQSIGLVSLVVRDYDDALEFFVGVLGFSLVEDTYVPEQDKRWVVVSPAGANESGVLLARASTPEQKAHIGNQTGGRVSFFCIPMIFGATMARSSQRGSCLCAGQMSSRTVSSRCSRIFTAINGICFSRSARHV